VTGLAIRLRIWTQLQVWSSIYITYSHDFYDYQWIPSNVLHDP
jgi:hypothetical protein